jgi:hypothetical protein
MRSQSLHSLTELLNFGLTFDMDVEIEYGFFDFSYSWQLTALVGGKIFILSF